MNITIDTDVNAPGCPCQIIEADRRRKNRRSRLIHLDIDYPGVASMFGWNIAEVQRPHDEDDGPAPIPCPHENTDGTIPCRHCGMTAGEFITAAYEFLTDNDGLTVEDPGYFN